MTVDQLVDRFAEIGIAQDQALLYDEISKFSKLYWQMKGVDIELRARGEDARRSLLRLYDHPNMHRHVIESISESNWFPHAGEAGMTLYNLDSGFFKPD